MPDLKTAQGRAPRFAERLFSALRSAGFQPAVSQACSLPGLDKPCSLGFGWGHAEWNSAMQQTGSLRYSFGQIIRQALNRYPAETRSQTEI